MSGWHQRLAKEGFSAALREQATEARVLLNSLEELEVQAPDPAVKTELSDAIVWQKYVVTKLEKLVRG